MAISRQDSRLAQTIEIEMDVLYRVALRLTKSKSDAEDLVQETCMRAWRGRRSLSNQDKLKSWLFRILRNTWIDKIRKAGRRPMLVELTPTLELAADEYPPCPPSDITDREQLEGCLDQEIISALDDLNEDERLSLLYHTLADMSYLEIAETLECPLGTVMSRVHRGRVKLRDHLANYARTCGISKSEPKLNREGGTVGHGTA